MPVVHGSIVSRIFLDTNLEQFFPSHRFSVAVLSQSYHDSQLPRPVPHLQSLHGVPSFSSVQWFPHSSPQWISCHFVGPLDELSPSLFRTQSVKIAPSS